MGGKVRTVAPVLLLSADAQDVKHHTAVGGELLHVKPESALAAAQKVRKVPDLTLYFKGTVLSVVLDLVLEAEPVVQHAVSSVYDVDDVDHAPPLVPDERTPLTVLQMVHGNKGLQLVPVESTKTKTNSSRFEGIGCKECEIRKVRRVRRVCRVCRVRRVRDLTVRTLEPPRQGALP